MTPARQSKKIYWPLILIFILFSMAVGLTGYFFYQDQKESLKKEKWGELGAIADLKARQIANWRKERMEDTAIILESPFISNQIQRFFGNPNASQIRQEILEWMKSLQRRYHYQSIFLLDAKGRADLSIVEGKEELGSYAKTLTLEALRKKEVIFSDIHQAEIIGEIHIDLLIPFFIPKGSETAPSGVLLLRIHPNQFLYPLIQSWPAPSQSAETLLVRREGEEVIFLNELRHRKGTALNLRFPVSEKNLPAAMAVLGKEGIMEGVDYRGMSVLAAMRSIPDSPWFLVTKIDQEEIYAPIRTRTGFIIALASILIIGAAFSVILLRRGQHAEFERKQYEAELQRRALAEHFDYLTRYANDIILLLDENMRIVEANDRAVEIYGYTRDELLQLTLKDLRTPDTRPVLNRQMKKVKEQNGFVFESFHQRKDGTIFPVENSSRVIEVDQKKFYQSIVRDVTERKKGEEELREREEYLRTVIESSMDAIIAVDEKGHIVLYNRSAEELFLYTQEEVFNQPVKILLLESAAETHQKRLESFLGKGVGQCGHIGRRLERTFRRKDGTTFEAEVAMAGGRSDQVRLIVVSIHDITEQKKAEEALRKSEERFKELYDSAPIGYYELDSGGRITQINSTELEMVGYSLKEMIGQPAWKFIVEEDAQEAITAILRGQIPPDRQVERTFRRKDGTTFPGLLENQILRDTQGQIIGIRTTMQDIAERKRAQQEKVALQEQLRQSQKIEAIGRLAGGVAHDFNNLLTVINGYSQLLLNELRKGDPLRENVGEIKKATQRASDLTRQLLAFSRRQMMEMKVLDLNILFRDLDKMLRRVIGEDIELLTLLSEDLGRVKTDPGQIEQVIVNLAVNARDAMPSGGKMTIETANVELDEEYARNHVTVTPGRYVMFSVSDTGTGMTPEVKELIFEPFFTTKERGKGTGLGLSTVYGIVKQSGGSIWVYSEPDHGTTFKVYLPRVDEPLEKLRDEMAEGELLRGNETILVVEDEEEVRKLAIQILQKQGYHVLGAAQGGEALLICEQYKDPIHLMLTDVIMPKMSGRELADRLANLHPEMKVLFMSGYTDNTILHHGVLDKGVQYIQKPFSPEALARKIRKTLGR